MSYQRQWSQSRKLESSIQSPKNHPSNPIPGSTIDQESSSSASFLSEVINNVSEMMGHAVNPQNNVMGSSSFDFDLNLPPPPEPDETHHQDSQTPAAVEAEDGLVHENDSNERTKAGPEEEKKKRERRFAALLEVVRIVSGDDGPSEPIDPCELMNISGIKLEGNASAAAKEEDTAAAAAVPAGRRTSGRVQVLPNKYRDSVVEPITSLSSRHSRSSSSKHVPTKGRRSR